MSPNPLLTLKTRREFQRVRGGAKWSGPGFLIDCKPALVAGPARFGFTVTKKLGNAVVRNRIRRRLKEAVRATQSGHASPDTDYVIIARPPALDRPFDTLCRDFSTAFTKLQQTAPVPRKPATPA